MRNYCAQGRVNGAFLTGKTWNIPETAEKPVRLNKHTEPPADLLTRLKAEKTLKLHGGIYQKVQIDLTYSSNHIEGGTLTHDQTEIIRNYAERSERKTRLMEYAGEDFADNIVFTFEDKVLDRAVADQIFSAAKALPPETYRVFVLYYGFEMTIPDICAELDVGKEAVKSRLFRARNELRKVLSADRMQGKEKGYGK